MGLLLPIASVYPDYRPLAANGERRTLAPCSVRDWPGLPAGYRCVRSAGWFMITTSGGKPSSRRSGASGTGSNPLNTVANFGLEGGGVVNFVGSYRFEMKFKAPAAMPLGVGHARRARHRSGPHASRPHGGVDRGGVPRRGRHRRATIRRPDWPADTRSRPITLEPPT